MLCDFFDRELWLGNGGAGGFAQMTVYEFLPARGPGACIFYNISAMFPGVDSIVRPDGFVRASAVHGGRFPSSDGVGTQWVDHWVVGNCAADCFELDMDVETNQPVKDYGTGGPNSTAANVFDTMVVGRQPAYLFAHGPGSKLDISRCVAASPAVQQQQQRLLPWFVRRLAAFRRAAA